MMHVPRIHTFMFSLDTMPCYKVGFGCMFNAACLASAFFVMLDAKPGMLITRQSFSMLHKEAIFHAELCTQQVHFCQLACAL